MTRGWNCSSQITADDKVKRLDILRYFTPIAARLEAVEAELERCLHSDVAVVDRLASHVRGGKGKRLRPALVLLCTRMCGVEGDSDVRFAAAFELVHTATLIHDDVIDRSDTRRGKATLHTLWGSTLTVLFGDLLYLMSMSKAIEGRNWRMMEIMADVTTRMIEGELLQNDVLFHMDTSRQDYFEIQERKTALLFAGCTETGAVLAGRPLPDCEGLRRYGLEIGRAFQLVDDLLDYTSSPKTLGKPVFSDLKEGKLTLPMLTLLESEPEATKALIKRVWEANPETSVPKDVEDELRGLIQHHNALSETKALARRASEAAREALKNLKGDEGVKKLLLEIPNVLLERSS
jgi:octaprenyl-diphosphate synthase